MDKTNSDLAKRISQLEERLKHKLYLTEEKNRKERTRRLIQTGALAEQYFKLDGMSIEKREELFKTLSELLIQNK